ncbi:MAG: class II fumarate hydratase, partial [Clostridia bacterium]|nr:class II fumarate hydratase [Clostridia bacterium]
EHDTMGTVYVPQDRYWGAQTQRSYENFRIGTEKMPPELIRAFAVLKKGAAMANVRLGNLDREKGEIICAVCDEILEGKLDEHFPLAVWQTGSGTQTNMNVNEVIANRGNERAGTPLLHPNDDVNRSQSSNDTFPTAMSICALSILEDHVLPALSGLENTLCGLARRYREVIKVGRTHLQDATPLTLGQEISGWAAMLEHDARYLKLSLEGLGELALGGTAVGTGLNASEGFAETAAEMVSRLTGKTFRTAPNKFHALTSKDQFVFAHGAMKALAADLMKIANDIRLLSSGPRCGIGELLIPENEPGSSIMPGKVNPTQCEAVTMVALQVMGNDTIIGMAASQGNYELNVFMPVLIHNFLQSARLLADVMDSFERNCVRGIRPNTGKIREYLSQSLMLVTALNPIVGYENAAKIAKMAYNENLTLREAAIRLQLLDGETFDRVVRPEKMVGQFPEEGAGDGHDDPPGKLSEEEKGRIGE